RHAGARPAAGRRVAAADDLRPGAGADRGRQGLQRPRAGVRHAADADRRGRVPCAAAPGVASGRLHRSGGGIGGPDRLAERTLRPGQAARVAGRDERRVVPVGTRRRRVGHRPGGGHRAGSRRAAARPVGRGRGGVLDPDGAVPRRPGCPLAVRRHGRDPPRHLLRPAGRPGDRAAPAAAAPAAACRDAAPGWRPPAGPRRTGTETGMNPDQAHQGGKTHPGDTLTAIGEPPGGAEPVTQHTGRLLPASRYRHPGDVIRLIVSAVVLTGTLAAVAVAHRRLLSPAAPALTWPGSGPAAGLLTGLLQVAFVVAAAGIAAAALRRRRFRLLAGLTAGA